MRRITWIALFIIIIVSGGSTSAQAQGGMGMRGYHRMDMDKAFGCGMMGGGMMGGGMMGAMLCGVADEYDWEEISEELDLKKDQKERLMEHNNDVVRNMMESRNTLSLKMFDLNSELKKSSPDQEKIDKMADDISDMRRNIMKRRVQAILKMREVLTAEQWARFRDMKPKERYYRGDRMMPEGMRRRMR